VPFNEYRAEIHNAYHQFQTDNPKADKKAYDRACKPIVDFCDSLATEYEFGEESKKNMVARMDSAKQKFTNLVCL
jgi:hypothetical protein